MNIERIAVIGLGYVGLPLACALARSYDVIGFDVARKRIDELGRGIDHTREITPERLAELPLTFTAESADLTEADLFLITVPTPVDLSNRPDLAYVLSACATVGAVMKEGAIVVLESTVYPGVTEDICGPALAKASGLICGTSFFLGYSPERINPGDKEHTIENVTKVVSGQSADVLATLIEVYGSVGPVHAAPTIKTAEAAKVIENAQRDMNIAFVNELAIIFHKLGIDTQSVLEAAGTKWNFLPFRPGLVGGHCISVDPYYLTYASEKAGYHPEVILSGRRINDNMGSFIGGEVAKLVMRNNLPRRILALGLTFKENVPDLRNSKSYTVIEELTSFGFDVDVHDPVAEVTEAEREYAVSLVEPSGSYGAIVLTVAHSEFAEWSVGKIESLLAPGGVVADVKGLWRSHTFSDKTAVWRL